MVGQSPQQSPNDMSGSACHPDGRPRCQAFPSVLSPFPWGLWCSHKIGQGPRALSTRSPQPQLTGQVLAKCWVPGEQDSPEPACSVRATSSRMARCTGDVSRAPKEWALRQLRTCCLPSAQREGEDLGGTPWFSRASGDSEGPFPNTAGAGLGGQWSLGTRASMCTPSQRSPESLLVAAPMPAGHHPTACGGQGDLLRTQRAPKRTMQRQTELQEETDSSTIKVGDFTIPCGGLNCVSSSIFIRCH